MQCFYIKAIEYLMHIYCCRPLVLYPSYKKELRPINSLWFSLLDHSVSICSSILKNCTVSMPPATTVNWFLALWLKILTCLRFSFSEGKSAPPVKENEQTDESHQSKGYIGQAEKKMLLPLSADVSDFGSNRKAIKTLKDAIKPKNKRKKKVSSITNTS